MTTETFDLSNPAKPTIKKDPSAVLDYTFDFTAWLGADTINSATLTPDSGALAVNSHTTDGKKVVAWLSGGTVGSTHSVTCHIVTAGGREDDRTIYLKIKDR